MTFQIGVISRSQEFIELISSMALNKPVKMIAQQTFFYQAPDVAQEMIKNGVEVIIARARTANLIDKSLSVPVIHCDFRAIDVLLSLSKSVPEDYPLALIIEENRLRGTMEVLDLIERLWGHRIDLITYSDFDNLEKQLQSAVSRGLKGVVGGKLIVEMASQFGLNKIELFTSQETARVAFEQAISAAKAYQRAKREHFFLTEVLKAADEALVILDNQGKVTFLNPQAEAVLDLKKEEILGGEIPGVSYSRYAPQIDKGEPIRDKVFTKARTNQSYLYSLIPLSDPEGGFKTSLLSFRERFARESAKGRQIRLLDHGLKSKYAFGDIIGESQPLLKVKKRAQEFAKSDGNVLIVGETGTGKELFAHSIHQQSARRDGPFVAINCAALPPSLLESELFGYESGAFTGASRTGKKGLFELANGGTIFLDEIGEMPLDLQARLLRVLENKEILRLGADRLIPTNFRVISSTNRDLEKAIGQGEFRYDLFYRLNTLLLPLPPLRERRQDIPDLVNVFLNEMPLNGEIRGQVRGYIDGLLHGLAHYGWPGNVRELRNLLERCATEHPLLRAGILEVQDLIAADSIPSRPPEYRAASEGDLKSLEREAIISAGNRVKWSRKKMSEILGISQTTLWRKMKTLRGGEGLPSSGEARTVC